MLLSLRKCSRNSVLTNRVCHMSKTTVNRVYRKEGTDHTLDVSLPRHGFSIEPNLSKVRRPLTTLLFQRTNHQTVLNRTVALLLLQFRRLPPTSPFGPARRMKSFWRWRRFYEYGRRCTCVVKRQWRILVDLRCVGRCRPSLSPRCC